MATSDSENGDPRAERPLETPLPAPEILKTIQPAPARDGGRAREIMQYSFLSALADDGTIDADELAFIKQLALRDGLVDVDEREVLATLFSRLSPDAVDPDVWVEIEAFMKAHGID